MKIGWLIILILAIAGLSISVMRYVNYTGFVSQTVSRISIDGGYIVLVEKFNGLTTDFLVLSDTQLANLSNMVLEIQEFGKIIFNESVNLTQDAQGNIIDLDSSVNISNNLIEINTTISTSLEKAATIYLYNLTFDNPHVLKDGVVCPDSICDTISYSGRTLIFTVTQFSFYSTEETVTYSAEETPGGAVNPPSGGGGGGAAKKADFYLNKDLINVELKQGERVRDKILVSNKGNKKLAFNLNVFGINRFVILSEDSFTLIPTESKEINVDFFASENEPGEIYGGKIIFNTDSEDLSKSVNVILEIKEKFALFDIKTELEDMTMTKEQKLKAKIYMTDVGDLNKKVDVNLEYFIKDFDGNAIKIGEETVSVYKSSAIKREFAIPQQLTQGNYLFYTKLSYQNSTATSSNRFFLIKESKFIEFIWLIIIVLMILVSFIIFLLKRRKKKEKKRKLIRKKATCLDNIKKLLMRKIFRK